MTNVYADTQYSIKKPKCQGKNLMGCNLGGKKDEMSYMTQGSWKCLLFSFWFLFIHLNGTHLGEVISTINVAKKNPQKLCYPSIEGIFLSFSLSKNE